VADGRFVSDGSPTSVESREVERMSDLGTPALLAIFIGAALEGLLVIAVVCVTVMSAVLPSSASIGPVGVGAIGIVVIWVIGIMMVNRTRDRLCWRIQVAGRAWVSRASREVQLPVVTAPVSQASRRMRLRAMAVRVCWRKVFGLPR
jgi:hypothetical protein